MALLRVEPGRVTVLTIDRPPANALTREFFVELTATVAALARPAVRAVVLTGSGRFFSAGLDLNVVFAYDEGAFADFTADFDRGFAALFALEKPLVAAVNGHAVAGGAVLAATADVRLIADGAGRVGLTELQLGVPFPASALEIVRAGCAGPQLTELLYLGRTYPPAEACGRRLVDEVVPADELTARAHAVAEELATREPAAFAATKRALRAEALARMAALPPGADPAWAVWRSPETRAAVEAYRRRTLGTRER